MGFLEQFPDSVNVCPVTDFASVRILGEGGRLLGVFSGIARYVCVQHWHCGKIILSSYWLFLNMLDSDWMDVENYCDV